MEGVQLHMQDVLVWEDAATIMLDITVGDAFTSPFVPPKVA